MMHLGPYDDEPKTLAIMNRHLEEQDYAPNFEYRMHHEIYISDPRKTAKKKIKDCHLSSNKKTDRLKKKTECSYENKNPLFFLCELYFSPSLIYASMKESNHKSKISSYMAGISIHEIVKAAPFI